ncbi:pirin family protein [Acinetobacter pragensis]|uniref:Pirin n=1 Tax=Acinetobacter pragensis TaxID=1806892 RepID=A0A151Y136_9GAMM|nr:pirin family protein [Acinetobacter pragensis]KYQ71768.1 pirin [Acinetobacter pragensis]
MKTLAFIHNTTTRSAVGDFAPVTSVFSHYELGNTVSPFLLLDHIGPGTLKPIQLRKEVDEHPHRGFETVTIMFKGELEHRDSTGGGGIISAGDVQWMTAASGVIHKEVFSDAFSQSGGPFEMLQLWVNLPAKDKMNPPRYQSLSKASIPKADLANDAGFVRVIAGEFQGQTGPAQTHTPMQVYDVYLHQGHTLQLPAQEGDTTLIYMCSGRASFAETNEELTDHAVAVMSSHGQQVELTAQRNCSILYLSAQPLNEPISGRGYFVMNTFDEIVQAYEDLKNNQFIQP